MKPTPMSRRSICAALALCAMAPAAMAQAWPEKEITLIVPGPAGGTPDVFSRQLAEQLRIQLGRTVIVDNRAGAAGAIGASAAQRSAPDGYTLLVGFAQTMAINPIAFKALTYDPVGGFEPVARLVTFELGLVVPRSVPANNVAELSAWLKKNTEKAAFGSFGNGTPSQFAGEMFSRKIGLDSITHVPYKGSAPLVTELIGGFVNYGFVVPQVALPHVKSGKLKLLAVTGDARSPVLPKVPTMKELGFAEIVAGGWYGLFAPSGTPPAIVDKLSAAVQKSLQAPALAEVLKRQDLKAAYLPSAKFAAFQKSEIARWKDVAASTHFTAED